MSARILCTGVALALACALAACSGGNPALAPLKNATLTAGVGWGELKVGQTTLASVVQRFGVDSVTQLRSDDLGLELLYEHGQIALLFLIDPACLSSIPNSDMRPAAVDLPGFLERVPCLKEQKLSSLSVRADVSGKDSFFQGATEAGVKLGAPKSATSAHGPRSSGPGQILAGMNPNNSQDELHFTSGICFFSRSGESGEPRVQRITIYPGQR